MLGETKLRKTTGVVDSIEPNGMVFVHEDRSRKRGFLADAVPVAGNPRLRRGTRLALEVEDRGNVMVVARAHAL
jgi:hypothetical protein